MHVRRSSLGSVACLVVLGLAGCASAPQMNTPDLSFLQGKLRVTEHRDRDDLLSAGLGLAGLRNPQAPALSNPQQPTAAELRRRAIYANWRGIADLSAAGSYGVAYGADTQIPGREFSAFARIVGAQHPHRVLTQIPDAFDQRKRCLLVTASSGSRGVYGAIALAGAWGLPRGCAVAYTDKGTGTGFVERADGSAVLLDGTRSNDASALVEFRSPAGSGSPVAIKHAHSGDHPEADWGQHVQQAAAFGLHALNQAFPEQAPFTPENTRIIAAGLSNGAGAVLRAAEGERGAWFDAVMAAAPNISVKGATALFDYGLQAALYQSCALLAQPDAPALLPPVLWQAQAKARCAGLAAAGLLSTDDEISQAREALQKLRAVGYTDAALRLGSSNTSFDLWRSVLATYVQSYLRAAPEAPVCGYRFGLLDASGATRAASNAERALWWSDTSGIAPAGGVALLDANAVLGADPGLPGLLCIQQLRLSATEQSLQLANAIDAVRASAQPRSPLVLLVHGSADALIPLELTSRPYVQAAQAQGHAVHLWEIERVQHFDAFLGFPQMSDQYPLLAYAYAALDRIEAVLDGKAVAPASSLIRPRQRQPGSTLDVDMLMLDR
jgi:hydroxybutyrate-dimer hydrolase